MEYNNREENKTLTLVSCFYVLSHAKFPKETYVNWLSNFTEILIYNPYLYLVIYTDEYSFQFIKNIPQIKTNVNIAIKFKPLDNFYMYKYVEYWRKNHETNHLLKMTTGWELNMLWSEKLWFLKSEIDAPAFSPTPWYAWCDAGYFRNRTTGPLSERDLHTMSGKAYFDWASPTTMNGLDKTKIYYALVNSNLNYIKNLKKIIQNIDPQTDLPSIPIPQDQVSIGGGFCLLTPDKIDSWCNTYETKLNLYFIYGRTVKDDQIILANCIFDDNCNINKFFLVSQAPSLRIYDPWFVFQRFLM